MSKDKRGRRWQRKPSEAKLMENTHMNQHNTEAGREENIEKGRERSDEVGE